MLTTIVRRLASSLVVVALGALGMAGAVPAGAANPYPTPAVADYVFAFMAVNGQTQEILQRCSCSIDVIDSLLPYERY